MTTDKLRRDLVGGFVRKGWDTSAADQFVVNRTTSQAELSLRITFSGDVQVASACGSPKILEHWINLAMATHAVLIAELDRA